MATFFLLLIIFFVVIPLIRAMAAIYRARRATRRFFDRFSGRNAQRPSGSAQTDTPPPAKKINPDDGEFVAFEELPADAPSTDADTAADSASRTIVVEQQIVDVEWEEIK